MGKFLEKKLNIFPSTNTEVKGVERDLKGNKSLMFLVDANLHNVWRKRNSKSNKEKVSSLYFQFPAGA